jgi:hypothetical protein
LRSIAARGDEEDRARARAALELQSLRQERAATAVVAGPLLLPRATKRRTTRASCRGCTCAAKASGACATSR